MTDINKIQLIHDIQETFKYTEEAVSILIQQIEDADKKANISRFFRGYKIEDNFQYLMTALPWVRLVHKLDQTQLPPTSKEEFQVPDYQIYYEDFRTTCHPSLVEVKSVTGQKRVLKLQKQQVSLCSAYADIANHSLLYAIFWENWNIWTINSPDQFEEKSSNLKIDIETAIKNDLSVIYGNVTYHIPPLKRISVFDSSITNPQTFEHKEYGTSISDSLSVDGISYVDLNLIDSTVLDSFINMDTISIKREGTRTILTEESTETYMPRILSIVMAHISLLGESLEKKNSRHSFFFVHEFLEKMKFRFFFSIPNKNTNMSHELYKIAFKDTTLLNDYEKNHNI